MSRNIPYTWSAFFVFLLLLTNLNDLSAQNPCTDELFSLIWANETWEKGKFSNQFDFISKKDEEIITVEINVGALAKGSFTDFNQVTPYIDGQNKSINFGQKDDLGIIFHPDIGQGRSPVFVEVLFSKPVACVNFEISDIDVWGSSRKDSVVIWSNEKSIFPKLRTISNQSTVRIADRAAVAIGSDTGPSRNGSAYGKSDAGTIHVDFGEHMIESFIIEYFECSGSADPGGRGIGILGNFTFTQAKVLPAELLTLEIDKTDDCHPVVSWSVSREFHLDTYILEYSYDGFNFQPTVRVEPHNIYAKVNDYNAIVPRQMNANNYLKLTQVLVSGESRTLAIQAFKGTGCQDVASINVYPNPARRDHIYVEIDAVNTRPVDISIVDQYGKQVLKSAYQVHTGSNWFSLNSKYLVPGIYHIHFNMGNEKITRKISIMG